MIYLAAPDRQMSLRAVSLALLKVRAIVAPTAAERLERIERDLDAIRKEVTL